MSKWLYNICCRVDRSYFCFCCVLALPVLHRIQAVEVSAPNGTHGTDKADMAESDAVVDPTVARVAR